MIAPTSFFADYGCHVRILEEIRALQRRGHRVRLCTYHNGEDVQGIDIRRTVDVPWRKRPVVGSSRHKMYLDVGLFFEVARQAVSFRPDIIHAHLHEGALIGSVIGRALRKPVVFDYQGSLTEEMLDHKFLRRGGLRHRLFRRLERFIDGLPSVIVPSGPAARAFLLKRGVDPERVQLVEDAVDVAHLDPELQLAGRAQMRHALGIPNGAPTVVYLGLLADYQGIPLLIDAARRLLERRPDAYVVIAGFPGVDHYSALAAGMPVDGHVLFPGRIPYADAPALLAVGDVAVAPKLSMTEGNGKVINYMAMGLPVVAIDTPANRTMLGDLGRFVAPDDPESFAQQIECAFDEPAHVREELRARVLARYSWDQQVYSLEEIYGELLGLEPAIENTPKSSEATVSSDG